VSREIYDLCKISDLLVFVSYFASQRKGIKFGDYFSDVCYAEVKVSRNGPERRSGKRIIAGTAFRLEFQVG